jgi:E3 ubiquitin-protein ligase synoviolin
MMTVLAGMVAKRGFLGTLRVEELDVLQENCRFEITETCLALTIFREELSTKLFSLFTALLFFKIFHWLCTERMVHTETRERDVPPATHLRLVLLISTLVAVDSAFVLYSVSVYQTQGPTVMIYFGFQFLSLAVTVCAIFMRYVVEQMNTRHTRGNTRGTTRGNTRLDTRENTRGHEVGYEGNKRRVYLLPPTTYSMCYGVCAVMCVVDQPHVHTYVM